ncbi:calcium-transporting ATPase 12, plasma membrane-type-like [Rhodamnia argentea]|uniref:Calcium-transporting ATPase 12, plasma membrane-type-like n=1 Tax=Rhodamnia argentea TaxID=178133 RepID=A0ABM3H6G7_9MYRT|nr:calcium-transporting ATPase 12, plasma membrane-type-like [Rhodamnia argentea]
MCQAFPSRFDALFSLYKKGLNSSSNVVLLLLRFFKHLLPLGSLDQREAPSKKMSQKSSADASDIESQQESLLNDAGGAPGRRWRWAFQFLKANPILISTANDPEIKACAVEDGDVESQQPVLHDAGKTLRRWWRSVSLVFKFLRVVSTADKTGMETRLGKFTNLRPILHVMATSNDTEIKACAVEDRDVESQQPVLHDAGKTLRRWWRSVSLVFKFLRVVSTADKTGMETQLGKSTNLRPILHVMATSNDTEIKACAVEDRDVESQQPVLHDAGKTLRRWWRSVSLVFKFLRVVSTADKTGMETQLGITVPNTREPEPTHELLIDNGRNIHEATDLVLQIENVARMIMEKDLTSLQAFGGVQGIAEALNSDMVNGIPGHKEDLLRLRRHATILKPELEAHNRRFVHFLGKSCNSCTILLLLILAILSSAFGIKEKGLRTGWYEGALTLGAVILIVTVHSVCEYRNESSRQLSRNHPWQNQKLEVRVVRGGNRQTICISDVLLGDIVLLEKGDQVPADGLLVPPGSLEVSDKADAIIDDHNPFLFCGSKVIDGAGQMLVTSVGAETELGIMSRRAQTLKRTPVEKQLNKLSTMKQIIGVVISMIITVVLFLRFNLKKEHQNSGLPDFSGKPPSLKALIEAIKRVALRPSGMLNMLTSFILLLVGIAEGLPLAITIAITCWNKRMLGDRTFAQEPSITVTMASVTVICTDRAEGLPLTPQEVERCWIGKEVISEDSKVPSHVWEALCDGIGISSLLAENSQSSMDNSILSWAAEKWGLKTETWEQLHSIVKFEQPTHNKNIVAALLGKDGGNGPRFLHFRGPATLIVDMCSQFYDIEGIPRSMDISEKTIFGDIIEQMLSNGLESIAFACKQVDDSRFDEGNLTMLGLLGLNKTSREDTREVINKCREAGIKVLLVSSEKVSMLQSIAAEIEVIPPDSDAQVITGESFRNSTVEQRMDMAARISVMGNSLPSDRLLLVNCLKDQGHTVAVVGNRTNDIPMLKAADVGLTFGTWSAEIARKSADIVITEGNFSSIWAIMECGRCIYSNMRKYIQFQLTMTFAGLLIQLITVACHGSSPITTVQLNWAISVLTLLGGLALLMEPPGDMLMKKFTAGAHKQLITKAMWVNIFIQSAYQASLLATIQSKGPTMLRLNKKVFNMFNAREPEKKNIFRGVQRGKWFWVGVVAALLLQVEYLETAHRIAGDSRLTCTEWGICLFVGITTWCIDLAGKCILLMIKKWVTKPPGSVVGDN